MDMKELRKNAEKVILSFDSDEAGQTAKVRAIEVLQNMGLDLRVLQMANKIVEPINNVDLEHPEEIPIEHEFVGYRQDGDVAEDYQGNLYLILCDPGIHPIGSVCMEQSELDDAVKLGKREDYTGELLEEIPE